MHISTKIIIEANGFPKVDYLVEKKKERDVNNCRYNIPGKRWIRTLMILSTELNTKLQRQTIKAHANGPCNIP
jgi:hypothetical protein